VYVTIEVSLKISHPRSYTWKNFYFFNEMISVKNMDPFKKKGNSVSQTRALKFVLSKYISTPQNGDPPRSNSLQLTEIKHATI